MGRFSKYWPWWARTVWLFTGQPPKDFDASQQEILELEYKLLDAEIDLIERTHYLEGIRAQIDFLKNRVST